MFRRFSLECGLRFSVEVSARNKEEARQIAEVWADCLALNGLSQLSEFEGTQPQAPVGVMGFKFSDVSEAFVVKSGRLDYSNCLPMDCLEDAIDDFNQRVEQLDRSRLSAPALAELDAARIAHELQVSQPDYWRKRADQAKKNFAAIERQIARRGKATLRSN